MLQFIKQNKIVSAGALIAVLALLYYATSFGGDATPPLTSTADTTPSPVSQELLVTLTKLHVIRLDDSLFKNPAFVSLTDFGVTLPPEAAGRRNPFAPTSEK